MKDGRITLNRAVKCAQRIGLKEDDSRFKDSQEFFKKYGFHYEECWSLDYSIAYEILIRLVQLKRSGCGCPGCFARGTERHEWDASPADFRRWETQLDKMIRGFYLYVTINFPDKKEQKIIDKGLKLFIEHYSALWN